MGYLLAADRNIAANRDPAWDGVQCTDIASVSTLAADAPLRYVPVRRPTDCGALDLAACPHPWTRQSSRCVCRCLQPDLADPGIERHSPGRHSPRLVMLRPAVDTASCGSLAKASSG